MIKTTTTAANFHVVSLLIVAFIDCWLSLLVILDASIHFDRMKPFSMGPNYQPMARRIPKIIAKPKPTISEANIKAISEYLTLFHKEQFCALNGSNFPWLPMLQDSICYHISKDIVITGELEAVLFDLFSMISSFSVVKVNYFPENPELVIQNPSNDNLAILINQQSAASSFHKVQSMALYEKTFLLQGAVMDGDFCFIKEEYCHCSNGKQFLTILIGLKMSASKVTFLVYKRSEDNPSIYDPIILDGNFIPKEEGMYKNEGFGKRKEVPSPTAPSKNGYLSYLPKFFKGLIGLDVDERDIAELQKSEDANSEEIIEPAAVLPFEGEGAEKQDEKANEDEVEKLDEKEAKKEEDKAEKNVGEEEVKPAFPIKFPPFLWRSTLLPINSFLPMKNVAFSTSPKEEYSDKTEEEDVVVKEESEYICTGLEEKEMFTNPIVCHSITPKCYEIMKEKKEFFAQCEIISLELMESLEKKDLEYLPWNSIPSHLIKSIDSLKDAPNSFLLLNKAIILESFGITELSLIKDKMNLLLDETTMEKIDASLCILIEDIESLSESVIPLITPDCFRLIKPMSFINLSADKMSKLAPKVFNYLHRLQALQIPGASWSGLTVDQLKEFPDFSLAGRRKDERKQLMKKPKHPCSVLQAHVNELTAAVQQEFQVKCAELSRSKAATMTIYSGIVFLVLLGI